MLATAILFILLSIAVNSRRDIAILYNRISIISLLYCIIIGYTTLTLITEGIALHGGLLLYSDLYGIFHIFIFLIVICILILTGFYPGNIKIGGNSINNYLGKKSEQFNLVE